MAQPKPQTRLIGFADAVTQAGDHWRLHGSSEADKTEDKARARAFIFADGELSPHENESWKMEFYTIKSGHPKLNAWRGSAS
jgi:hypothetical protein